MIFDNDYVTELAIKWRSTHDPRILEVILEKSMDLIGVIVSSYDPLDREDLIQESAARIQYALPFFDPTISNLHNFLTTVVKNICLTYLRKQNRYAEDVSIDLHVIGGLDTSKDENELLTGLIARNRARFPTLTVDIIDSVTEYIYYSLISEGTKRDIIAGIVPLVCCTKAEAGIIYSSTLIYLRVYYKDFSIQEPKGYDEEYSIIPDLREIFGDEAANILAKALTGMSVRFP